MATKAFTQTPVLSDPPFATVLLNSPAFSWLWLIIRLYLGFQWIESGIGKLQNPAWTVTGAALKGFFMSAIKIPEAPARPLIAFDWYRVFLTSLVDSGAYVWFAKLIAVGELLVGVALVLGLFTAVAAFFGGFMNWNFMMAGTASANPVMFFLSILLILAWKTAGWIGLDNIVLRLIGTPWQPGKLFAKKA